MRKIFQFDFDGTCADTEVISKPITEAVLREFLASHGLQYVNYIKDLEMTGKDFGQVCADLGQKSGLDVPADYLRMEKLRPAISSALLEARLAPSLEQTFIDLNQAGAEIAIVTNSPRMRVQPLLDKHELMPYVSGIYSALEDTKVLKPNPSIYLHACDRMDVSPVDVVSIEDSVTGMLAATAAGIGYRVGYLGLTPPEDILHKHLVERLNAAGAHVIVYHMHDLVALMKDNTPPQRPDFRHINDLPSVGEPNQFLI